MKVDAELWVAFQLPALQPFGSRSSLVPYLLLSVLIIAHLLEFVKRVFLIILEKVHQPKCGRSVTALMIPVRPRTEPTWSKFPALLTIIV